VEQRAREKKGYECVAHKLCGVCGGCQGSGSTATAERW
jgi:hypothetical protein